MRRTLAILTLCAAARLHAATVTYDFNSASFAAAVSGSSATASDMAFELAVPAPGTSPQVQQLAERSDSVGGICYYINQRSFNDSDVVSMAVTESGVKFTVTPAAGTALDFSSGTLSLDVSVYSDGIAVTDSIGLYAIVGGVTSAVDTVKTVTNPSGGSNTLDMYEVGTTTRVGGWNLTATATTSEDSNVVFDLSAMGTLSVDQSVTFKVTGLVNLLNTANFNSSFDNYVVTFAESGAPSAAAVTYDLDSGLSGSTAGSLTVGALSFTNGLNSDASDERNAERGWYDGDASGDYMFYISGRSSDNKGTATANLDMTAGAPSYLSFTLTPAPGESFDFSSGTLSLDSILYNDGTLTFDMGYQLWADIGSGWTSVGGVQVVDGQGGGTGSGTVYEVDETTVLSPGNAMTAGTVEAITNALNFDLSTLGSLSSDQTVTFAVALSGTRDNHYTFNSGMDDIVVSLIEGVSGNNVPLATNDTYGVDEEDVLTVSVPGVLANDGDADGDPLTAVKVSDPVNGSLSFSTNGSFSYTPDTNFYGVDSFTYRANDGTASSAPATVTITVTNVADAPVAVAESYGVAAGASLNVAAPGVLGNDSDADGDSLTAVKVSDPLHGSLALTSGGAFVYTPDSGYLGTDSFEYRVYDGSLYGNTVTVSVTVAEPVAGDRPNILLFFVDDMGYGDTTAYNTNCPVDMPHVELLAEQGMRFTDAHTPAALCAPNRYSLLAGNYVWRNSGNSGWNINEGSQIASGQETVADMLKKAGYVTAMFGKGHIGGDMPTATSTVYGPSDSPHPQADSNVALEYDWTQRLSDGVSEHGFDYSFVAYGGIQEHVHVFFENDWLYGDPADAVHLTAGTISTDNGLSTIEGNDAGDGMPYWYSCEVGPMLTQKTLDFIDRHYQTNLVNGTSEPFFIHYCSQSVHVPHTPPDDFLGTAVGGTTQVPSSKGGYSQHSDMLYEVDVALGKMLDALDARGLLENTLIIFTSDNGGLKDAVTGTDFSNQPLNGYKSTAWEGGHRVPFIVKWGDGTAEGSHIPPGSVADQMVNIMDIYTTLAEMVGVNVAADQAMDSVSLRSILLEGNTNEVRTIMAGFGGGQYYLRDGNWKYIQPGGTAPEGLYDLGADLGETVNLLATYPSRVSTMNSQLNNILAYEGTTNRTTAVPAPVPNPAVQVDADGDGMEDGWERLYFASTNALNGGALDDIDQDGLGNLAEYALGGHPTAGADGDSILPKFGMSSSDVEYVFNRRTNAATLGLVYQLEHTDNLVSNVWSTGGYVEVDAGDLGNGLESVTNLFSTVGKTNEFIRLKIISP